MLMEQLSNELVVAALGVLTALWLDRLLGEPTRFHPLVGFGCLAMKVEHLLRKWSFYSVKGQGVLAWGLAVVPFTLFTALLIYLASLVSPLLAYFVNVVILYLTLGGRSLVEHADNIYRPLSQGDIEAARTAVSMIVSRNTDKMTETEITSSAVESVLENGNDAVFAPIFWFMVLGAPGAVLFRLTNTLDAMWGYKNSQYKDFGYLAAKSDDAMGYIPARITAVVYAFQGRFSQAIACWHHQAKDCSSPNGGVVMTTGAGALGVKIGGPTYYHGVLKEKKAMGTGAPAKAEAIPRANQLVTRGSFALTYLCLAYFIGGSF